MIKKLIAPLLATVLILIAFSGAAAGEQALAANMEFLVQNTTNGTIFLQLFHTTEEDFIPTNSANHEALGRAIYETKQYRCFNRDTNETLPYYIRKITTSSSDEFYDLYIGVGNITMPNSTTYAVKMNVSFEYDPENTYDIQNHDAVIGVFGPFVSTSANKTYNGYVANGVYYTGVAVYNATLLDAYNASRVAGCIVFGPGTRIINGSPYIKLTGNTTGTTSGNLTTGVYANTPFNALIVATKAPFQTRTIVSQFASNVGGEWIIQAASAVTPPDPSDYQNPSTYDGMVPEYWWNSTISAFNITSSTSFRLGGGRYNIESIILFNNSMYYGALGFFETNSTFYNTTLPDWNLVVSGPQSVTVSDIATYTATIHPTNKPVVWHINGTAYSIVNQTNNTITVKFHNTNLSQQSFTLSAVCATYSLDVAYRINATMPTLNFGWLQNGSSVENGTRVYFYNSSYDMQRIIGVRYNDEPAWDTPLIYEDFIYNWTKSASYLNFSGSSARQGLKPIAADPNAWVQVQVTRNGINLGTLRRVLPIDNVEAEPHTPSNVTFVETLFDNISFTWHSAPGNLPLTLEVTTDDSFTTITGLTESVAGNSSDGGIFTIPATALEAGTYFWRLVFPDGTLSNVLNFTIAQYHDYGDIGIQVIDADIQTVVPNATVSMGSLNGSVPLTGTTNETGWVFFENVTDGYMAYINASGYVEDQIQVMPGNNYTVQLARTGTTATIYFSLIDNSGQFSQKTSYLEIYYNDSLMETAYFDVSGTATATLRVGRNYSITIVNGNASRSLGFLVPTGNQTIRLVVGDLLLQQVDPFWLNYSVQLIQTRNTSNIQYETNGLNKYSYNTTVIIDWEWNESANVVSDGSYPGWVIVYYDKNNSTQRLLSSKSGHMIITIDPDLASTDVVRVTVWYATADTELAANSFVITLNKMMYENLNVSENTRNLMCLCFLFIIALLFSPVNAQIGAIITVAAAGILYALGLLIISPAVLFFVAFIPIAAIFGNKYLRGG